MGSTKKKKDSSALRQLAQRYKTKYGTGRIGYRKCRYGLAKKCLKVAPQELFKGLYCKACLKVRQQQFYQQRKGRSEEPE